MKGAPLATTTRWVGVATLRSGHRVTAPDEAVELQSASVMAVNSIDNRNVRADPDHLGVGVQLEGL